MYTSINQNSDIFFGILHKLDSLNEEDVYSFGSNENMPIALALMLSSNYTNSVNRYFNLKSSDTQADDFAKLINKQSFDLKPFIDKFNNVKKPEPLPTNLEPFNFTSERKVQPSKSKPWSGIGEFNMDLINKPNYDLIWEFYKYADKFAQFLSMKTYYYRTTHNSSPQACSTSYINYENRPEFSDVYKSINNALDSVMKDVIRIINIREIPYNKYNMTIDMPGFSSIKHSVSYMF